MASLTLNSALMKARFSSFNLTLPSVMPVPGSGPQLAGRPSGVAGAQLGKPKPQMATGNRPAVAGFSTASSGGSAGGPAPEPTGTPLQCPPALFKAATNYQIDCEYQKSMSDELGKFFDAISRGLTDGMNIWKLQANFTGVKIIGPSVIGGKIQSPHVDAQIEAFTMGAFGAGMTDWTRGLLTGVARGFSNQWKDLCNNTRLPGLPWYPAFAAVPSPTAPPMPNIPCPFMAIAPPMGLVTPAPLKAAMVQKAPNNTPYADQVFTVVSEQLGAGLSLFFATQMVINAMGTGPVPNFAPPYIPVGQVLDGYITADSRPFAA